MIKAATWPEVGSAIKSSIDEFSGDIIVVWDEPYDNADSITYF